MISSYLPDAADPQYRDVVKLVNDRKQAAIDGVRTKYREVNTWLDAFNGVYTGKIANYLNDVTVPLVFATIMSSVARTTNSIFGSWPIVTFQGFNDGAGPIAKKNELLINVQLKEAESFAKAVRFFMLADICGTGVGRAGWTTIQRLQQYRTYIPGMPEMVEVKDLVTTFNGPDWDSVDLLDFWPEPGKLGPRQWSWWIERYWCDFDDLLELNSGDGLQSFRPEALQQLAQTGMPSARTSNDELFSYNRYRNFADYLGSTAKTAFSKPVEIWEMRGLVPMEFAPDGVRDRIITIANGSVVLRNEPNKVLTERPRIFCYSPTPDPYHFVGISKARIAEPLQAAASRLLSTKLDSFDLFLKMPMLAQKGAIPTQNLHLKPGRVVQVNTKGRPLSEVIQPLPLNLQPMAMAFQELGFLDSMIQKGTGIDERAVMGLSGGGQEMTARQFLGQQDAAMTRLALESMLASTQMVEPIAELFRDMNKTMLPLPKQFSLIGSRAFMNPITGMPLPPEQGIIMDPAELNHSWQAKAFGPMFMLTKSAQRADALQLAQVMMSNPVWIQVVNWVAMAKKLFSLYDWDTDEMLVQMPQMQQFAQMLGTSPQGVLGAAEQDPMAAGLGGASGQSMAPVQKGEQTDNAPLGVGP